MRRLHPHDLRAGAAFGDELLKVKREPGRDGLPWGQSPVVAQRTASGGRRAYPACGGRSFPRTGTCRLLGNLLPHALDSARAWRPVDERLERATHRDPDGAAVNASAIIPGCVSVVIPALDEAVSLACLIEALRREPELKEIIVVDGGSIDGTAAVAARLGARVVTSERGHGQQLRTGGVRGASRSRPARARRKFPGRLRRRYPVRSRPHGLLRVDTPLRPLLRGQWHFRSPRRVLGARWLPADGAHGGL